MRGLVLAWIREVLRRGKELVFSAFGVHRREHDAYLRGRVDGLMAGKEIALEMAASARVDGYERGRKDGADMMAKVMIEEWGRTKLRKKIIS